MIQTGQKDFSHYVPKHEFSLDADKQSDDNWPLE